MRAVQKTHRRTHTHVWSLLYKFTTISSVSASCFCVAHERGHELIWLWLCIHCLHINPALLENEPLRNKRLMSHCAIPMTKRDWMLHNTIERLCYTGSVCVPWQLLSLIKCLDFILGLCGSAGVLLTYFTLTSFWLTLTTYGLLFGIGVGIAYAPPMACAIRVSSWRRDCYPLCTCVFCMQWLPDRKGLAGGIVVAGFGAGAFIFDQVQTAFINPNNLHATAENPHNSEEK